MRKSRHSFAAQNHSITISIVFGQLYCIFNQISRKFVPNSLDWQFWIDCVAKNSVKVQITISKIWKLAYRPDAKGASNALQFSIENSWTWSKSCKWFLKKWRPVIIDWSIVHWHNNGCVSPRSRALKRNKNTETKVSLRIGFYSHFDYQV